MLPFAVGMRPAAAVIIRAILGVDATPWLDSMPTISAVLIVRNEAERLPRCLESLSGAADEIVVADTGSDDGTLACARAQGAICHTFPWTGDFSAARNFALAQAAGDYALVIDADEFLQHPEAARPLLERFMAAHEAHVVGTVEIVNEIGAGRDARETVDHTERFFARGRFQYTGAIHEQLTPVTGTKESAPTGVRLRHTGYAQAPDDPAHKAHRNIPILEAEIARYPDDEYYRYQLGKAYFALERYAEAAEALEDALSAIDFQGRQVPTGRLGPVSRKVLTDLIVSLVYAHANSGGLGRARALLEEHAALDHPGVRQADFPHALGYVYLMLGEVPRAKEAYRRSLELGPDAEDVRGTGSYASAYHLGLLAEAEGEVSGALDQYLEALRLKPDYAVALSRCLDLIVEYESALPPEVWDTADRQAFSALYLERLAAAVREGRAEVASLLLRAAGVLAPELLQACKRLLQEALRNGAGGLDGHGSGE